ncbi:MAG: protein translocase subunit SecD [Actinomycetes bacterium]|jgi:SecD/SecF fusion protein
MLSKGFGWRLFMSIVVIAGSAYLGNTQPRLGLDLRGGTQIVYEAQDTETVTVDSQVVQRTVEVLRRRVDAMGTVEPNIQASGDRRIIVELPDVSDPQEAIEVIGQTAQLTFHPVLDTVAQGEEAPEGGTVVDDEDGLPIVIGPARLTGEDVKDAIPLFETSGTISGVWVVQVNFQSEGEQKWADLTREAACESFGSPKRRIAILLDDQVITSPQVSTNVPCATGITGGTTIITGNFDEESAADLALLIQAGALPVPIEIVEQGTIGPTLGETAIAASIEAALIGAGLTLLYMIAYYRLLGVTAAISLIVYALLSAGVLLWFGATITLPGIAGFVLAVGMAVDANVLIYERMKEEHEAGATVRDAAFAGFKRAFTAIADSNITTLLAAILLFFFATGSVRGFGVTLTIGVAVSMFTALVFTRVLVDLFTRSDAISSRPGLLGLEVGRRFRDRLAETRPNLTGRTGMLIGATAAVMVLSLAGLFVRGTSFGVEFSGGLLLEYDVAQTVDVEEVRAAMADIGLPRAVVQTSGEGNLIIRTENLPQERQEEVDAKVAEVAGESERVRSQFVGPTIGAELRNKALVALAIALGVQLIYLAIRFRWTMGLAAVLAMAHDLAVLIGLFAWMGKTYDGVFLAALLTVIGYSVNDSVVIFDRIREQRKLRPEDPLPEVVNDSALQTIPRTINTGMGALFILFALWLLGGDTLGDFALALIIGTIAGTYSSILSASPIYLALEERFPAPVVEPEPEQKPRVYRG